MVVLTFNSQVLKTMIDTFVYVTHKMPSFGQSLPHGTYSVEVAHSAGKLLNRAQNGLNLLKVKG